MPRFMVLAFLTGLTACQSQESRRNEAMTAAAADVQDAITGIEAATDANTSASVGSALEDRPDVAAPLGASKEPSYSSTAYCQKIGDTAGGSAVIERTCREQESEARMAIASMTIPERAFNYCDSLGETAGGSYVIFKTCVEQELEALSGL